MLERKSVVPELPEVETVCHGLKPYLKNAIIARAQINRLNLRNAFPPFFTERLENAEVLKIERRAKYILIRLNNDLTWVIHLGMSGRIRINDSVPQKHDHVVWTTDKNHHFVYNDSRRFGLMDLIATPFLNQHCLFANLGYEPFDNKLTPELLFQTMIKKVRSLKSVLLDQSFIVGLGNIYVCEALWLSHQSPFKKANTLSLTDWRILLENIRLVLTKAIAAGGSTLKDYAKPDGTLGYFSHQFNVYGLKHQKCNHISCIGIISRVKQSGRSTFYCPECSY